MSHEAEGPAPLAQGDAGPEILAATKPLSLAAECNGTTPETAGRQLRRRLAAALRCEPLPDGQRDPWRPSGGAPPTTRELDACARAQAYLRSCGVTGLPAERIRRAWAAQPDRYAAVFPRWPAA